MLVFLLVYISLVAAYGIVTTRPIKLFDPHTLTEMASFRLPQRPVNRTLNVRKIVKDSSGGSYFYLDHLDRAVFGLPDNTIKVIGQRDDGGDTVFALQEEYDLSPALGAEEAKITAVLPDWEGRYWFATRFGTIGIVDPEGGHMAAIELPGEEIQTEHRIGTGCRHGEHVPKAATPPTILYGAPLDQLRWGSSVPTI